MTASRSQAVCRRAALPRNAARLAFAGLCAAVLLALQGCGSVKPVGEGGGASSAAAATVNAYRAEQGLPSLTPDAQLEQAALQQARYMAAAGRMEHTTGWGKDFASRVKANGIAGAAAENIAAGRMDTARVLDTWMHSPPHRRNMLDRRFTRFGLAYVRDSGNGEWRYWAMVLGK
ncbi:MAG: CAP domain-containing protein [Mesorhizobium sp.]|nr:CAP domain-containing protein [Mesorhizobium sp.]MBN9242740.1 CAP domain-containing protein [Mesorhizobium sp.]MBN9273751.1 CAP domain-containing protein [Mesorhizobium sp.]